MNFDIFLTAGNILFLISSYPLIKEMFINKNSLKGFSFFGSLFTFIGMIFMFIAFINLKTYITALISIPTIIYWGLVSYYSKFGR